MKVTLLTPAAITVVFGFLALLQKPAPGPQLALVDGRQGIAQKQLGSIDYPESRSDQRSIPNAQFSSEGKDGRTCTSGLSSSSDEN